MDPLGSVIAVIEFTVALTNYINDVRNAPKERAQLGREASNLYALLTSLRYRVEDAQTDDPWFKQIKLLAAKDGALGQFKTLLERLVAKLHSSSKLKDLLWKFNKPEVDEALAQIERLKSLIIVALSTDLFELAKSVKNDVAEMTHDLEALRLEHDSEWPSKLSTWLDVPDPSSNYATALKKRQEGTGSWLLEDKRFLKWASAPGSSLWVHGIPGCGKTILSATMINHIQHQPSSGVAYFYFDFNDEDKRDVDKCARSLIMQLAMQAPGGIEEVRSLHTKCRGGQLQPQSIKLVVTLDRLIQMFTNLYIVFDALDECNDYQRLLDLIENDIQHHQDCLHFLATSRTLRELEERLLPIIADVIPVQAVSVDADINVYVEHLLKNDLRLRKWPTDVRNEIRKTIAEKSNGMFRWAYCQIDALRRCIKLSTLRQMLSTLPKTLDDTYERILTSIEANGQLNDAVRVLQWLCFARRPQSLKALVDVLATDVGSNGYFLEEERLPDPFDILVICSSLLTIREEAHSENIQVSVDPEDPIIQLAHFSVREYLLSGRCFLSEDFSAHKAHGLLAEISLIYTLHFCVQSNSSVSWNLDVPAESASVKSLSRSVRREDRTLWFAYQKYPLGRYASAWWYKHIAEIPPPVLSQKAIDMAIRLFENSDKAFDLWFEFCNLNPFSWSKGRFRHAYFTGFRHDGRKHADAEFETSHVASPVFYAAATGLTRIVEVLIQRGNDVNRNSPVYPSPLHVAVLRGDLNIAKLILSNGGNVDQSHAKAGTPLQIASASGHNLEMVRLLLKSGATASRPAADFTFISPYSGCLSEMHGTTIHAASYGGSVEVLKCLLEASEDINVSVMSKSILRAIGAGFEEAIQEQTTYVPVAIPIPGGQIAKSLAPPFSSNETQSQGGRRTMSFTRNDIEIVHLLLSRGLQPDEGLWDAYSSTDTRFFFLLLGAGASGNVLESSGEPLLHRSLHENLPGLFNALLKHGADIAMADCYGFSCFDYMAASTQILMGFHVPLDACQRTSIAARQAKLFDTAFRSIETILQSHSNLYVVYPSLRKLGHCLVHLKWRDDALIVYQMTICKPSQPATGFRQRAYCDGCRANCPDTSLFHCETCRDIDLCAPCFQLYRAGTLKRIHLCQDHEFLEVPLVPFDEEYCEVLPCTTPKVRDWLQQLKAKILRELPESTIPDLERAETLVEHEESPPSDLNESVVGFKVTETRLDIEEYLDLDEFA